MFFFFFLSERCGYSRLKGLIHRAPFSPSVPDNLRMKVRQEISRSCWRHQRITGNSIGEVGIWAPGGKPTLSAQPDTQTCHQASSYYDSTTVTTQGWTEIIGIGSCSALKSIIKLCTPPSSQHECLLPSPDRKTTDHLPPSFSSQRATKLSSIQSNVTCLVSV